MFRHPWRVAIVLAALVVVGNLAVIVLDKSDTTVQTARNLPNAIQSLSPEPGSLARLQDTVTADLRDNLTGVLVVDGHEIPEDQTDRVASLAEVSFRPGPGKDLNKFDAGTHTVTVLYWPQNKDRPANPASYTWQFRTGA